MAQAPKVRHWVFTLNNYTAVDESEILKCNYKSLGYGKEVGESGTPHLQGWIAFHNPQRLSALKKIHARAHWEPMKGTLEDSREYCKKDGDYVEFGDILEMQRKRREAAEKGGKANKERWSKCIALVRDGLAAQALEEFPDIFVRYHKAIDGAIKRCEEKPYALPELDNRWYYGPSGTGKSKSARDEFPDAYVKLNNKWWDGYDGEDTVIIDDLDKYDKALGGDLKRWSDHYPFPAEYKGGVMVIRPKRVIVTSNYLPEEIWDDEQTTGPINRRFKRTKFDHHVFNPISRPPTPIHEDEFDSLSGIYDL
ncbi:MAG: putative viral replication protein [Circoviridae sp.]|nr:MAG: putative viral replication protein [Circoviridae sp.]